MQKNTIKNLLRLNDEPYTYVDEMTSHNILIDNCNEFMETLVKFYNEWSDFETDIKLPLKQVFVNNNDIAGDYRLMPCSIESMHLKFVKIIGTNEEQRKVKDKISVGKALLIDYFDNYAYAVFDVCAFSSFRTAAISVLALHCSNISLEKVGIIGTGRIGFYTAFILYKWHNIKSFTVCDTNEKNYQNFVALCKHYMPDVTIEHKQKESLLNNSEAVFLATTASESLLNVSNSKHIRFISSVGADADNLSEIDASLLNSHRLITDSFQSTCLGDMKKWNLNTRSDTIPTELKHFILEKYQENLKVLFISTGIAVQDALICKFIYDKMNAVDHNI
ncbi:MAG: hypothetical protein FP820_08725 [Sulfurimonas sp.]|nr:hypothetical protein [Sulfurimonas sp.]MBU3938778.1 hypothetical protein [bacterium]MBU4024266.1 hypothetical protein [bacterium]MBU4058799.1 hypothetical protein [bacterium]